MRQPATFEVDEHAHTQSAGLDRLAVDGLFHMELWNCLLNGDLLVMSAVESQT